MGKLTQEELTKIKNAAESYRDDMTAFLRAIVKHPGESSNEAAHVEVIKSEMEKVGFDEVRVDNQGNVFWERIEIGCTNIMESGCGIMAAFNALRFSKEIPVAKFPDAILQLEKMNVMFEKTGALPSEIKQFIGDNGITITPLRTKNELINFLSNNQGNKAVVLTTINNEATLGLTIGENLKMHTFLLVKYLDNLISSYYAINGSSPFDLSDISENPLEENAFVYGIGIIKENNNE